MKRSEHKDSNSMKDCLIKEEPISLICKFYLLIVKYFLLVILNNVSSIL